MPLFYCIHCGQYIDADDDISGLEGNCPRCEGVITVPGTRRQLPQVVIKKLEPPTADTGPVFQSPHGPSFAVYEPLEEIPAVAGGATAASPSGRRVVIKELPSLLSPMVPQLAETEASTVIVPTERLSPPPEEEPPALPPEISQPPVAEVKAEPVVSEAPLVLPAPTLTAPLVTITLTPPPVEEVKPAPDVPPLSPPEPAASAAPTAMETETETETVPSAPSFETKPAVEEKISGGGVVSAGTTSASEAPSSEKPSEESSPAKPAESSAAVASTGSSPKEETPPQARVSSWKPKPYVEPVEDAERAEAKSKNRAPYLPAQAVGMVWLLGGALWQVGLMLVAGPDSLIREKCRESVLFLFATFVASLVMVAVAAALFGFLAMTVLRMMKRKAHFGSVFCVTLMVLGVVLLAAGLLWYEHGCPWLQ